MDDIELLKKYNQLYLEIILRYKEYIEEKESLYVAELPKLVMPENEDVVNIANKLKGSVPNYTYDENYYDAARLAYSYVKDEITLANLPIQFWLTPDETIKCGAGDIFDKAVLLCSLLVALGNVSAKVIIKVEDSEREFLVYSEFNNSIIAMDLDSGIKEYKNKDELLLAMGIKSNDTSGEVTAYEFNDKMYNSLE
ncbi:MAG: hypothetical protein ACP5RF_02500 [Candidatus Micrarchaeia archaeon]